MDEATTETDEARVRLGQERGGDRPITIESEVLLRHAFAVGSSGSGKTVFCKAVVENCARLGIPAICVDPQGDLASVVLAEGEFAEAIDPVIFTPASEAGVPLCVDPIRPLDGESIARWSARAAMLLTSLLGYSLDSDDGDGISVALAELLSKHRDGGGRAELSNFLDGLDVLLETHRQALSAMVSPRTLTSAERRLRRLGSAARRELFVSGLPLDIDELLAPAGAEGKVRVAVIYLNSLESQEDKELVVAALADRLYRWMLSRPCSAPQLLFYIDEVAPYLPPVRKPACKDGLVRLLKQARKYGVGCILASQNPGDVDYRALGQLGTWALGRLVTRQDIKKIEPSVSSLAGARTEAVLGDLPRLKPGEFWLLSPDAFADPVALKVGRLLAPHRTLDLDEVASIADSRWRVRFAPPEPSAEPPAEPESPDPIAAAAEPLEPATRELEREDASPKRASAKAPAANRNKVVDAADRIRTVLIARDGMRTIEVAEALRLGTSSTSRHLRALLDQGRVAKVRRGREVYYFWIENGGRPDLDIGAEVTAAQRLVLRSEAESIGKAMSKSRLFGLLPDPEEFRGLDSVDVALYAVDYREPLRPGTIARILGERASHLEGSVYFDAESLELLHYEAGSGIRFGEPSSSSPTEVEDLDGVAHLARVPLADLSLHEPHWQRRRPIAEVTERFNKLFVAEVLRVRSVFVPLWRLRYQQKRGRAIRIHFIDGLAGQPVEWPGPI